MFLGFSGERVPKPLGECQIFGAVAAWVFAIIMNRSKSESAFLRAEYPCKGQKSFGGIQLVTCAPLLKFLRGSRGTRVFHYDLLILFLFDFKDLAIRFCMDYGTTSASFTHHLISSDVGFC